MVLNALESIMKSDYQNWHLTLIDDSGNEDFKENFLNYGFDKNKISYIPILIDDKDKVKMGGSIFGKFTNEVIKNTDADVIIPICDDDALFPDYMTNLNKFYLENPDRVWGYCHLHYYDPETQHYSESQEIFSSPYGQPQLNLYKIPINPSQRVDSSQVTFRKRAFVEGNVWYPHPHTADLDLHLFRNMFSKWGSCHFTNCTGQYKGWFINQLGKRMRIKREVFVD
jgi:glycosyltransferase involved in cell wall biosynthesis